MIPLEDSLDEPTPRRRRDREDSGPLGTFNRAWDRYRPLWIAAFLLATAFGFNFETPAAATSRLTARLAHDDTLLERDSAFIARLIVTVCMDTHISTRDKQLVGLPCP